MKAWWLGSVLLLLAGCVGREPLELHLLSVEEPAAVATGTPSLHVGIGPVRLASYLERDHLLLHGEGGRLAFSPSRRWAEPVDSAVARGLVAALEGLRPDLRAFPHPWPRWREPDLRVDIWLWRLDAYLDGRVVLWAQWVVRDRQGRQLADRESRLEGRAGSPDPAALVEEEGRLLRRLATEIEAILPPSG